MNRKSASPTDKILAKASDYCVVCKYVRKNPETIAAQLARPIEAHCPFCNAFERVHGHRPHAPQGKRPTRKKTL
jgi:hypothetical protein